MLKLPAGSCRERMSGPGRVSSPLDCGSLAFLDPFCFPTTLVPDVMPQLHWGPPLSPASECPLSRWRLLKLGPPVLGTKCHF